MKGTDRSLDHLPAKSGMQKSGVTSGQNRGSAPSTRKDFLRRFVDWEVLTQHLEGWFSELIERSGRQNPPFDVPFDLAELQKFDYALEGVPFHQLIRMPNAVYDIATYAVEAAAHLGIEDFLHASLKGLWHTFWCADDPMPFLVASLHGTSSKFYPAEKAIASGKVGELCATCVMLRNNSRPQGKWDEIVELTLLRSDIGAPLSGKGQPSFSVLGEALFFALRVLLSRNLSRSSRISCNSNCVFVLLVDSQCGSVIKLEGDVSKLAIDASNIYGCAAQWIIDEACVTVSPIDRIWNRLGNANWGDIATLHLLLATFHCMVQFCGLPKHSVEDLASRRGIYLQNRQKERDLVDPNRTITTKVPQPFQHCTPSTEIVEVQEEISRLEMKEAMKLEEGSVVWLDHENSQQGFRIVNVINAGEPLTYNASAVEEPGKTFMLYFGSRNQLNPTLNEMDIWYQVRRQIKILKLMIQRGISSKYLPHLVASGRIIHPGECRKPKSSEHCEHPWCGTPILVASPVGDSVSEMVRHGKFCSYEALRCCHDVLCAISAAASAGIRHGDVRPENVIRVTSDKSPYYVLVGWGHAVLEEKDRPSMNLLFSSTSALQDGKLCAASDAESLIYLLYFSCGGIVPNFDSVEKALRWRELSWSKRVIQQKIGDISAVLKAFADYIDRLCGTPFPIDCQIWIRRLKRVINEDDHGKQIAVSL